MNEIPIPSCITDKLQQLNQLAEKYPLEIPVSAAAEFLGCDGRNIRSYLMMPDSFGMGWKKPGSANRGFFIPTVKFFLWYRNIFGKEI